MSDAPMVLVVEDDRQIRRFLRALLTAQGYRVVEADTGKAGLREATARVPDIIVLDLGLPDMEGIDLLREVRQWSSIPVIVLSARGQERHKVEALDSGADDYLTKPFGASELCARLRVALRHSPDSRGGDGPFTVGDLKVDLAARRVTVGDREVHLTPIEYRLLAALVKHAGKVLTHGHLLAEVWGPGCAFENTYPRVYMSQLRRKLEKDPARPRYLLTESGVGYRLAAE